AVFVRPDDGVGSSVGGDAGSRAGVAELRRRLRLRSRVQLCARYREGLQCSGDVSVIYGAIEVSRRRPDAAGQHAGESLVVVVAARIEFSHRVAIDHLDVAVLAGADHQMAYGVPGIG